MELGVLEKELSDSTTKSADDVNNRWTSLSTSTVFVMNCSQLLELNFFVRRAVDRISKPSRRPGAKNVTFGLTK